MEVLCFLCHRKDTNYAYTFAAGCMQTFLILFKLLEFVIEVFMARKRIRIT